MPCFGAPVRYLFAFFLSLSAPLAFACHAPVFFGHTPSYRSMRVLFLPLVHSTACVGHCEYRARALPSRSELFPFIETGRYCVPLAAPPLVAVRCPRHTFSGSVNGVSVCVP